ncbi:hypothetical protein C6496_03085 [Candidatus Poribacteria bacterium]|nr:MAG: hypothetical protein C6496_03085 [Candidatus Poribacteria bacterium]
MNRKEVKIVKEKNPLIEEAKRLGVHEVGEQLTAPAVKPVLTFKEQTGSYLDQNSIKRRKNKRKMAKKSRRRNRK